MFMRIRRIPHEQAMTTHPQGFQELCDSVMPFLEPFTGAVVVIKYGGNAMVDQSLQKAFAQDVVLLREAGLRPVVVHGGGPQINEMLTSLGIESEFIGGLRKTTPEVMNVVGMVLVGQVQRELVGLINEFGPVAVGVSGEDAHMLLAEQRQATVNGELIDIGLVGDIVHVNTDLIETLLAHQFIPVVSTVAKDSSGSTLNVNADTAAAALAQALNAKKFIVLTDVEGLYRDWPHSSEVISSITAEELNELLPSLASGMVPKMEACLRAVEGGVPQAHVIDGRAPHSLLMEVFTDSRAGTVVVGSHE
jgi:acetylglutamate kinase